MLIIENKHLFHDEKIICTNYWKAMTSTNYWKAMTSKKILIEWKTSKFIIFIVSCTKKCYCEWKGFRILYQVPFVFLHCNPLILHNLKGCKTQWLIIEFRWIILVVFSATSSWSTRRNTYIFGTSITQNISATITQEAIFN